jgi:hypothetical protein
LDNITVDKVIYLTVCIFIYRIISNLTLEMYENGTILQLIMQLIISKLVAVYTGYVVTEHEENIWVCYNTTADKVIFSWSSTKQSAT